MAKKAASLPGVKVVVDDTPPEVLAKAIVDVAESARRLLNSRLSKRTIIVLIQNVCPGTPLRMIDIEAVLDAAAALDKRCLKKTP